MNYCGINKVFLQGYLGKDAETRYTESGKSVTSFSLATTEKYKDKAGDWQSKTDWHNIVLWGKEWFHERLVKGALVCVDGKLRTRKYEDKNGNTRYVTEVVADDLAIVPIEPKGGSQRQERQAGQRAQGGRQATPNDFDDFGGMDLNDDDVPF